MSSTTQVTMSSQRAGMLSPPTLQMPAQAIDRSSTLSKKAHYRQKQVIDGDVVRVYETSRHRHHLTSTQHPVETRQAPDWVRSSREHQLQAAMDLPSSVLVVQGLRRLMNSDEPLYEVMGREQKKQLQREYLRDIGLVPEESEAAVQKKVRFPPSPPMTPRPHASQPVKSAEEADKRFCACCKHYCS